VAQREKEQTMQKEVAGVYPPPPPPPRKYSLRNFDDCLPFFCFFNFFFLIWHPLLPKIAEVHMEVFSTQMIFFLSF
jgi:hypothetical protein